MSNTNETRSPELQKLEEKLRKDPTSKLFFPLAEEYAKIGRVDEAIALLRTGVKAHPDFLGARVALGKALFRKGLHVEARQEFEQVIAANPDNLMAHKKLAAIYLKDGERDKALASCEIILAVNRVDAEVLRLKEEINRLPDQAADVEPTVVAHAPPSVEEATPLLEEAVEPTVIMAPVASDSDIADATEIVSRPDEPPRAVMEPTAEVRGDESWVEPTVVMEPAAEARGGESWVEPTVVMAPVANDSDIAEATDVRSVSGEPPVTSGVSDEPDGHIAGEPGSDDLATVSLADLYVAQGHYDQGIAIYRRLLERTPADHDMAAKLDNALTLARLLSPTPVDADEVKSEIVSQVLGGGDDMGMPVAEEVAQPSVVGAAAGPLRHQAAIHRLELWLARIAERRHR
ncbi:MAG: tetratricopeptide repeat protein [Nitrospirota bacterium]